MERFWFVTLIILLTYLVYLIFAPFLIPLAWGIVLTIVFYPVHERVRQRIANPDLAALASTILLTLIIILPALAVIGAFATQAVGWTQELSQRWSEGQLPGIGSLLETLGIRRVADWLMKHGRMDEAQLNELLTQAVQNVSSFIAAQTGRLARNVVVFFFDLGTALFATFYLFRDGSQLMQRLRRLLPLDDTHREGIFYIAQNVLHASVYTGLIIAALQGLLGGLLFWAVGLKPALLWGVVMAFLALLPIVGPWLIWVPAAIYLLVIGEYGKAILLTLVGAGVVSWADSWLRPYLISGRTQMNGLVVFISILGGVVAFGMLGIILGPILVSVADAVLQIYSAEPEAAPAPVAPSPPGSD